ncbi:hypothetical protein KW450_17855 [Vibrio fluvialis]|nr:hypothetical protein [Vibrio fluvialis]
MELITLIMYGILNILMVVCYLIQRGDIYKAPFWIGAISLGWFLPQAIGGFFIEKTLPQDAYSKGMLFAFLCNLFFWFGWFISHCTSVRNSSYLMMSFNSKKIFLSSALLCLFGFYFQWKLWSLPDDMLIGVAWSGTVVKYWFLSGVFKFGFIILFILYLEENENNSKRKLLLFLIPCFYLMIEAAFFRGRRAEIMNLVSYFFVSLWFVRSYVPPRLAMLSGLIVGLIFINSIGIYRSVVYKSDLPLSQRVEAALSADYISENKKNINKSGEEFKNYIYQREAVEQKSEYDFGIYHWNEFVFNYIPAQLVSREVKEAFFFPLTDLRELAQSIYSHYWKNGTTSTGYSDSFGSFGWFGVIKFMIAGLIMGYLYRYSRNGGLIAMLLYIYFLNYAMHMITHGTNGLLVRQWIYFLFLVFPLLYLSREKKK